MVSAEISWLLMINTAFNEYDESTLILKIITSLDWLKNKVE